MEISNKPKVSVKLTIGIILIYLFGLTFIFTNSVHVSGGDMVVAIFSLFWSAFTILVLLILDWIIKKSFFNTIFIIVLILGLWIKVFTSYNMEIRAWYIDLMG